MQRIVISNTILANFVIVPFIVRNKRARLRVRFCSFVEVEVNFNENQPVREDKFFLVTSKRSDRFVFLVKRNAQTKEETMENDRGDSVSACSARTCTREATSGRWRIKSKHRQMDSAQATTAPSSSSFSISLSSFSFLSLFPTFRDVLLRFYLFNYRRCLAGN